MNGAAKAALLAAGVAAAILTAPLVIVAATLPSQTSQQFFGACSEVRGARAAIVPDPPSRPPSPAEVLLRIDTTATTLGFGRQGATVAAAISLRATALANAANPAVPDTERYAHSTDITVGAGALGLPADWGSAAELMTPQVSTALVLDRMVNVIPAWRDTDPAEMAAEILGGSAADYGPAVSAAQTRLASSPMAPSTAADHNPVGSPLTTSQVNAAAKTSPEAANCLAALTRSVPPAATGPNPRGADLAAAAQHAVGVAPRRVEPAAFVADVAAPLGIRVSDTLGAQFSAGFTTDAPAPGDLVFTDISADQGPHLVGIAVTPDTMVTILPGHPNPGWVRIGPNRIVRRTEVSS